MGTQPPFNPASETLNTQLDPLTEATYRNWVQQNNVPTNPDTVAPQDYDMRGFYQALMQGRPNAATGVNPDDGLLHYPDYWKNPSHQSFSSESRLAGPEAPSWINDHQLVSPGGKIVFDERAKKTKAFGSLAP